MKPFAELFKKYRLRGEFETIASFSNALAEKGYFYEESIFSHWQKGTRVPTNRQLILKIIEIFIEKDALKTIDEANAFLSSTGLGYLTDQEIQELHLRNESHSPFQVPNDIVHFTGRKDTIEMVRKEISHQKVFLLHGPAGIGKTALAIKLGHLLRNQFPDGVLWYKVDSSNVMDILLSIARLFGEDISTIKDVEIRASIVRALLAKKKVLLIFDNVTSRDNAYLLLPNTSTCAVIFSSHENILHTETDCKIINLHLFTTEEILQLFEIVFDKSYVAMNKKIILAIGEKLGRLPLALHIAAHVISAYSKVSQKSPELYLKQLESETLDLKTLTYEDKNLFKAVSIGFETLNTQTKNLFISLGVFEGKDFSSEAVAAINKLSLQMTKHYLLQLHKISFIDESDNGRYRTHPLMKIFARKHMQNTSIYLRAAEYYEQLLIESKDKKSQKTLMLETDNIIYIFKTCYDEGYWDEIITLWNPIKKFLSDIQEIKKLHILTQAIDTAPSVNMLQKILNVYLLLLILFWIVLIFSGLKVSFWNYLYSFMFSFISFVGGLVGIIRSKPWGLFSSNIGKAVFFISLGLFSWGSGNIIWAYYNFFQNIDVPYPSFADVGYFPAYILWILGIIYLSRATGAKLAFKKLRSKLFLLVFPIFIATSSYYFLLFVVKRTFVSEAPLRIFFDLYYPTMDIAIVTLASIIFGLSVNFFGGKYKLSLFSILFGFAILYISDFLFSYTTSVGTYFNGGFADLPFTLASFFITWGTLSFYLTPRKELKTNLI